MLKEGICISIGTDGASSSNHMDMVDEICEEVTMLSTREEIHAFDEKIQKALATETGRAQVIGSILSSWKVDYNHLCRI